MLLAMHVDNNRHCIRDGDAFLYEDILHLHTLTQTFHFTLTYIKRTNYVLFFFYMFEWIDHYKCGKGMAAFGKLHANERLI